MTMEKANIRFQLDQVNLRIEYDYVYNLIGEIDIELYKLRNELIELL